ncbi:MAG: AAA family ATPase, partial [bacterium]
GEAITMPNGSAAALVERLRRELDGLRAERQRAEQVLRDREEGYAGERRRQDELAGRLYGAQDAAGAKRDAVAALDRETEEARGDLEVHQNAIVGFEGAFHQAQAQFDLVKHEFSNEFGSEMGRFDELAAQGLTDEEAAQLVRLEARLAQMGEGVNLMALEEFGELQARYAEYQKQIEDLRRSRESLTRAIQRLDRESERRFEETFETIRANFHTMFRRLFGGGEADLRIVENEEGERGVEIEAKPPGKRTQSIALLSGGERALVSTSLLFALYMTKPSPFCFLDELDAPLDDANTDRFMKMLKEFSAQTQFIAITHNKHTMELVETLYGITMEEPGVSKVVSVRMLNPAAAQPVAT